MYYDSFQQTTLEPIGFSQHLTKTQSSIKHWYRQKLRERPETLIPYSWTCRLAEEFEISAVLYTHLFPAFIEDKDQSNLAKGRIAPRLYSPGGSSNLQSHVFAGSSTPKSSLLLGSGTPSNTM